MNAARWALCCAIWLGVCSSAFASPCREGAVITVIPSEGPAVASSIARVDKGVEKYDISTLIRLAKDCRDQIGSQVAKVEFFTDEDDRNSTVYPAKSSEIGLRDWLVKYKALTHQEPMASVIFIGDYLVARRFDGKKFKASEDVQVQGSLGDIHADLLDIAVKAHMPNTEGDPRGRVTVFLKSSRRLANDQETKEYGARVFKALEDRAGFPVRVSIRNDTSFYDEPDFPIRYRFNPAPEEPTTNGLKVSCSRVGEHPHCQIY